MLQTFAEASLRDTNQRSGHSTVVMHHQRLRGPSMVFSIARQPNIKIKAILAFPLSTSVPWLGCDFSHGRLSGVVVWPHARFVCEEEEDEVRDIGTQHMDTNLKKATRCKKGRQAIGCRNK